MEKQCFACKVVKPTSEFYSSPQTRDRLTTYCKACHQAKIKAGREAKLAGHVPVPLPPGSTKICRHCLVEKPIATFGKNRTTSDGLQSNCKPCSVAMVTASRHKDPTSHRRSSKAWRAQNLDRVRDLHLRWRLGVSPGTYQRMFEQQEGKCAICGTTNPGPRLVRFPVDHCEQANVVRGLLCGRCNQGIGLLLHDPVRLHAAIQYLTAYPGIPDPLPEEEKEGA